MYKYTAAPCGAQDVRDVPSGEVTRKGRAVDSMIAPFPCPAAVSGHETSERRPARGVPKEDIRHSALAACLLRLAASFAARPGAKFPSFRRETEPLRQYTRAKTRCSSQKYLRS